MKHIPTPNLHKKTHITSVRLSIAGVIGVVVACLIGSLGEWKFAPLAGWDSAVVVYVGWVWLTVGRMDSQLTKQHALRENPGRAAADVLLIFASVASLVAVLLLLLQASSASGVNKVIDIVLGLLSITIAWFLVHTTFMLTYARLFYGKPQGGVDFNESDLPKYADFAYLAFTIGMTYQVSDTDLTNKAIRVAGLRHALLSYLFGTVIIATTINTLASLSQ